MTSSEYRKCINFLYKFKLHNGNLALNKTLHNHAKLNQALLDYEKNYIIELEREILTEVS